MRNVPLMLLLLTGAVPSVLGAAELDAGRLPEDAKWVIHLDLHAVRKAGLVQTVEQHWPPVALIRGKLQLVKVQIGINPLLDVANITAYDNRYMENSGTVMIEVSHLDAGRLIAEFKRKQPVHQATIHGGNTIYSWTMHPGRPNQHVVSGAICGNTIVLSRNLTEVQRAIDRLDGRGMSLPGDSPLAAQAPPGTLILARARGMAEQGTPFRSSLLREARGLAVAVGMDGADVFVHVSMEAADPGIAVHYRDVVQGFRGLASLQFGDNPRAQRVLSGLAVDVSGCTASARWRAAGDDVIALAKNQLEKRRVAGNNVQRPANDLPSRPPDVADGPD